MSWWRRSIPRCLTSLRPQDFVSIHRLFSSSSSLRVCVIGRPNVGKSTLFNRLTKSQTSLVDDTPGMTRDRIEAPANLLDLDLTLVDTPGLDETASTYRNANLHKMMMTQTEIAVSTSDAILFVIDGSHGLGPLDTYFAAWLRKRLVVPSSRVVVVANKCEGNFPEENLLEAEQLGFGKAVPFSAAHGQGRLGLFEALSAVLDPCKEERQKEEERQKGEAAAPDSTDQDDQRMRLAIVGRTNVGKSTLVNGLVGQKDRVLVGPDAGITRDAVSVDLSFEGSDFRLVDTAGLSGITPLSLKENDRVDAMGMSQSLRAIRYANVVILLLDASLPPELAFARRETTIAKHVLDQGRCLVPVANKLDLVAEHKRDDAVAALQAYIGTTLSQAKGLPLVPVSALQQLHLPRCLRAALSAYRRWTLRIATGPLNRFVRDFITELPLPRISGRRAKLKYITQVKSRPPTFCAFGDRRLNEAIPYQKALVDAIRNRFGFDGIPIRLMVRVVDRKSSSLKQNKSRPAASASAAAAGAAAASRPARKHSGRAA